MSTKGLPSWLAGRVTGPPLPSRKNLVFRVSWGGRSCAAKIFSRASKERAATEYRVLGLCRARRLPVPRPLLLRDGVVIMTWLRGRQAFELVHAGLGGRGPETTSAREKGYWMEEGMVQRLLDGVASWLARFHRAFKWEVRRGDAMLKNFIYSRNVIYGIDFEESVEGDPLADVGQLCAHLLASGERFSPPLFRAAGYFAKSYWRHSGEDRSGELPEAVAAGLEHYAQYRRDGPLLRRQALKIRRGGSGVSINIPSQTRTNYLSSVPKWHFLP